MAEARRSARSLRSRTGARAARADGRERSGRADRLAPRFERALERLALRPTDRVLEIGCGHGIALEIVADRLTTGHALAIDRSARMTALARARNAAAIRAGRATVRTGALRDVDLGSDRFDLVFAINVALFAGPCERELARLRDQLAPDGRILAFYQAPTWAHALRFGADARGRFEHAGFTAEVEEHPPIGVVVAAHALESPRAGTM